MFIKYLKTLFILIPLIIFISFTFNFIKILDRNLSIFKNISLVFEATNLTKSEALSLLNFRYKSKNYNNQYIKKIFLELEPGSLEKSKLNIKENPDKKKYYNAIKIGTVGSPQKIEFRMRGLIIGIID